MRRFLLLLLLLLPSVASATAGPFVHSGVCSLSFNRTHTDRATFPAGFLAMDDAMLVDSLASPGSGPPGVTPYAKRNYGGLITGTPPASGPGIGAGVNGTGLVRRSWLYWNDASAIRSTAYIDSCLLFVYATNVTQADTLILFPCLQNPTEGIGTGVATDTTTAIGGCSWNNQQQVSGAGDTPWKSPGADSSALTGGGNINGYTLRSALFLSQLSVDGAAWDCGPYPFLLATVTTGNGWKRLGDVSDIVRIWREGRLTNRGILIRKRTENSGWIRWTENEGTEAQRFLVVYYWHDTQGSGRFGISPRGIGGN